MSDPVRRPVTIEIDEAPAPDPGTPARPRILETEDGRPIAAAEPLPVTAADPPVARRRRIGPLKIAAAGLGVLIAGSLTVDAIDWVTAQLDRSLSLGLLSLGSILIGLGTTAYWILSELRSLSALRAVEATQAAFRDGIERLPPDEIERHIALIIETLPKTAATAVAAAAYRRQVQPHHSAIQQAELLARIVLAPADAAAKNAIRRAATHAMGVTAISLTVLTDTLFFLARGLALIRQIAEAYGHRPSLAGTVHLVRRLINSAGVVATTDLVGNLVVQEMGGSLLEKLSATAAESFVAAQRMARLGIVAMNLCRPVSFHPGEAPSLSGLLGDLVKARMPPEG